MMDASILDTIDMQTLGRALGEARKKRGLTQEDAARILGVARTTITAIEKGERRIKAEELVKLAHSYGRQVSDFVRPRPPMEPLSKPQYRGPYLQSLEDDAAIAPHLDLLEEFCRDYLELEQIVGSPLPRKYPPEYSVNGLATEQAAEGVALDERNRLGLGDRPVPLLRDILEQDVGLRIFYLPLSAKAFSAIYMYSDQLGGCVAVNSQHPEERRRWSLAHDYGHFLVHRYKPVVFIEAGHRRVSESERFADYFALYFLMPTAGLTRQFNDIHRIEGKITPRSLCTMANYYGVSVQALTRRLEMLGRLPTGTWDTLRENGFKVRTAQQELGLGDIPGRADQWPLRYQYLAIEALDRDLISEAQFAQFLRVDRLEARRLAEVLHQNMGGPAINLGVDRDLTQVQGV